MLLRLCPKFTGPTRVGRFLDYPVAPVSVSVPGEFLNHLVETFTGSSLSDSFPVLSGPLAPPSSVPRPSDGGFPAPAPLQRSGLGSRQEDTAAADAPAGDHTLQAIREEGPLPQSRLPWAPVAAAVFAAPTECDERKQASVSLEWQETLRRVEVLQPELEGPHRVRARGSRGRSEQKAHCHVVVLCRLSQQRAGSLPLRGLAEPCCPLRRRSSQDSVMTRPHGLLAAGAPRRRRGRQPRCCGEARGRRRCRRCLISGWVCRWGRGIC